MQRNARDLRGARASVEDHGLGVGCCEKTVLMRPAAFIVERQMADEILEHSVFTISFNLRI